MSDPEIGKFFLDVRSGAPYLPSTRLRIDWTTTSLEMDAYKAQLFKSIIYKYRYKHSIHNTGVMYAVVQVSTRSKSSVLFSV